METTSNIDEMVEAFTAKQSEAADPVEEAEELDATEEDLSEDDDTEDTEAEDPETDLGEGDDDEDTEDTEETDDPEDDAVPEEPEVYSVKVDGVEQKVTLEELQRGYAGQGYIHQGMKEVAEGKRQAQAAFESLQEARSAVMHLHQQLSEGAAQKPAPPPASLAVEDPVAYTYQKAQYDEDLAAWNEQEAQIAEQATQFQAQQQQMTQHYRAEQARMLFESMPEISDPAKAKEFLTQAADTAVDAYGYTPDEISGFYDHRAYRVLSDAMKWRNLQADTKTAKKKAEKARPVVKPGSKPKRASPNQASEKIRRRLQQTGSVDDAVAFLMARQSR